MERVEDGLGDGLREVLQQRAHVAGRHGRGQGCLGDGKEGREGEKAGCGINVKCDSFVFDRRIRFGS